MSSREKYRIALVGTDTLRGKEMKDALDLRRFPFTSMEFFDPDVEEEFSKLTQFQGEARVIQHLEKDSLEGIDLVFLAADKKISREFGPLAEPLHFQAIDLSEAFNDREEIPLVVPGVNDEVITDERYPVIANPHPVTIILAHLFHLINSEYGVSKAIAFVLQPASAFDEAGIEELAEQTTALLSGAPLTKKIFKDQIAFNLLSRTEKPGKNGFSKKEKQIHNEVQQVLRTPDFPLSLSLIQVPVFHTYSIMTYVELARETDKQSLESLFRKNPLFKVGSLGISCAVSSVSVAGKEKIFIGQIKQENIRPSSFWIWAVADNLILGSALNALEIARLSMSLHLPLRIEE